MGVVKHNTNPTPDPRMNDGRQCERGVNEKKADPLGQSGPLQNNLR
jgi:hypothetical protein